MTKEWYTQNGYKVSLAIDQNVIDRAERDVMEAYVRPILPSADPEASDYVAHAVADLAFLLMLQRSAFITRAGAKDKAQANSSTPDAWAILGEQAGTCRLRLNGLRAIDGAVADAKVRDICKLSFTSNFIHV